MRFTLEKIVLTLLLIIVSGRAFLYIDGHNAATVSTALSTGLASPLDASIPFVPWFVLAYLLYYAWVVLPLPILGRRAAFYHAWSAFALVQLSACLMFVTMPSQMIRTDPIPGGVPGAILRWLYRYDQGFNVFPSLHVAHSVLVALIFWQYRRDWFPLVGFGALLIAASTVLIKQHYLVDIPAGALLAMVCYRCAQWGLRAIADRLPDTGEAPGSRVA
jgi:membrane-associated phospholipid phosphatase